MYISLNGLGAVVMPTLDVTLAYGGRQVTVKGGIDTGAEPTIVILDQKIVDALALPRKSALQVVGAGGAAPAYFTDLDLIRIEGVQGCGITSVEGVVSTRPSPPPYKVLIGEAFMKAVGGAIELGPEGFRLSCKGPQKFFPTEILGVPVNYVLIGGAALAGVGLLSLLLGGRR